MIQLQAQKIEVLDHGYVEYIEHMGSDQGIIEAARMSTSAGFQGWGPIAEECLDCGHTARICEEARHAVHSRPDIWKTPCANCGGNRVEPITGDEKLLRFLYEQHKHHTPFEMAALQIEVQAPIFVYRQWHKHRTQSFNEMSAHYIQLPNMNYVPTIERLMVKSTTNKQAGGVKGARELTEKAAEGYREFLTAHYETTNIAYQDALQSGVSKELARIHLPVARYSRMRATANLRNWLGFLTLRLDPHAQYEIRMYAQAVGKIIQELYPRTWELFAEEVKPEEMKP